MIQDCAILICTMSMYQIRWKATLQSQNRMHRAKIKTKLTLCLNNKLHCWSVSVIMFIYIKGLRPFSCCSDPSLFCLCTLCNLGVDRLDIWGFASNCLCSHMTCGHNKCKCHNHHRRLLHSMASMMNCSKSKCQCQHLPMRQNLPTMIDHSAANHHHHHHCSSQDQVWR